MAALSANGGLATATHNSVDKAAIDKRCNGDTTWRQWVAGKWRKGGVWRCLRRLRDGYVSACMAVDSNPALHDHMVLGSFFSPYSPRPSFDVRRSSDCEDVVAFFQKQNSTPAHIARFILPPAE